jgi:hypothetical protein
LAVALALAGTVVPLTFVQVRIIEPAVAQSLPTPPKSADTSVLFAPPDFTNPPLTKFEAAVTVFVPSSPQSDSSAPVVLA